MRKKVWLVAVMVVCSAAALALVGGRLASAGPDGSAGGISYASLPDEAALYLNDMVFARDNVVLPNEAVRVLLPPGTFPDTLILTENGARVGSYRVTPQSADVYYSQAAFRYGTDRVPAGGTAYVLTWEPPDSEDETREMRLEYLMSGGSWTPTYDMQVIDEATVGLAFFAEVHATGVTLDATTVYLVAGRVDLSQQVDHASQVTMNQYAVGYANETVELPALGVGSVDVQHVYSLGELSAEPGDVVYVNLVDTAFTARRLLVWNAADDQRVNVIYKVNNETELPLAQGIVRAYQDGMFLGSDYIETTPPGSEGSVTVGSLPDVRVRRTESREYQAAGDDYYQHTVTLEIHNFSDDDLALIILDRWIAQAWAFEYSSDPERQPDNLLRWEVEVAAGESLEITYEFRTDA